MWAYVTRFHHIWQGIIYDKAHLIPIHMGVSTHPFQGGSWKASVIIRISLHQSWWGWKSFPGNIYIYIYTHIYIYIYIYTFFSGTLGVDAFPNLPKGYICIRSAMAHIFRHYLTGPGCHWGVVRNRNFGGWNALGFFVFQCFLSCLKTPFELLIIDFK